MAARRVALMVGLLWQPDQAARVGDRLLFHNRDRLQVRQFGRIDLPCASHRNNWNDKSTASSKRCEGRRYVQSADADRGGFGTAGMGEPGAGGRWAALIRQAHRRGPPGVSGT